MDATDDMAPTLDVHPERSFQVLGPVRVVDRSGDPLPLGPPRRRTLLGALLVHPRVALSVDRLTDLVWDGTAPPTVATMVHGAVAGLRRVLEPARRDTDPPVLITRDGGRGSDAGADVTHRRAFPSPLRPVVPVIGG